MRLTRTRKAGDAPKLVPTFDGIPVAEMIKTIIDPRIEELERRLA
jgi:hypothetical protein